LNVISGKFPLYFKEARQHLHSGALCLCKYCRMMPR
jgi:hypothetical protein